MRDPIQKYFQMGTVQWMTHPPVDYPILESVKAICCDEYFNVLEVTHIEDQDTKDRVRGMLAQGHVKVCYGAQPRLLRPKLNPNDLGEKGKREAEAMLVDSIDEAEYMGTEGIAFLAGKWEPETKDQTHAQPLKATRTVCSCTASRRMVVELRVFDFDTDRAILIGSTPYAARLIADMRMTHNNFGLLVDLSHFPTIYETSRFMIRTLRPYITHLRIGNVVVKEGYGTHGGQHPWFGFPGNANDIMQLVDFFAILGRKGFFNKEEPYILSLKIKPWAGEDGDIILANTKRIINQAWVLVEDKA